MTGKKKINELPRLTVPRGETMKSLTTQIEKGKQLFKFSMSRLASSEDMLDEYLKWDRFTSDLLRKLFDSSEILEEYIDSGAPESESEDVANKITCLESILERLCLYEEQSKSLPAETDERVATVSNKVFVVHGRDDAAKEKVARFLEKLELEPIILHEQPNKGRTIIEKFEDHSFVSFAVVLLTPDDVGKLAAGKDKLSLRARQNVVFELGYFIGKLGKKCVCTI